MTHIGRRQFMKYTSLAGAGIAAPSLLYACGEDSSSGSNGRLDVLTYGGPVAELQSRELIPLMESNHNVSTTVTPGDSVAPRINSELNRPKYGLFTENILYRDSFPEIWKEIDATKISALENVHPKLSEASGQNSVPAWLHSACIVYNEDHFDAPPTLDAFTDPMFKGKVALQASPYTLTFAPLILESTGGTVENPEPMFEWLEKVIPNRLTDYQQVTQAAQLLQSEDIVLTLWYSGRAAELRQSGVPVSWVNDGAVATVIAMGVTPGVDTEDAAYSYISEWLEPSIQGQLPSAAGFSPVTTNAEVSSADEALLPVRVDEIDSLITPDWGAVAPKMTEWQQRYDEMVQSA